MMRLMNPPKKGERRQLQRPLATSDPAAGRARGPGLRLTVPGPGKERRSLPQNVVRFWSENAPVPLPWPGDSSQPTARPPGPGHSRCGDGCGRPSPGPVSAGRLYWSRSTDSELARALSSRLVRAVCAVSSTSQNWPTTVPMQGGLLRARSTRTHGMSAGWPARPKRVYS